MSLLLFWNGTAPLTVTPDPVALTLGQPAPTVRPDQAVSPAAIALALGLPAPRIDQAVSPGAIALTLAAVAPRVDQSVSPGSLALTVTLLSPRVDQSVSPAALALTLANLALRIDQEVRAAAIALALGLPAPSVSIVALTVSPAAIALALGLPAPSLSGGGVAPPTLPDFPTVVTTATTPGGAGTPRVVNLPAGITAGDLLLFFIQSRLSHPTTPSGWTQFAQVDRDGWACLTGFYRRASGSEGATVSVPISGGEWAAAIAYRIVGDDALTAPLAAIATGTTGANAADPPSLAPFWGAERGLWLVAIARDNPDDATAAPAGYGDFLTASNASIAMAAGERQLIAATENPGVFTHPATQTVWSAITALVRVPVPQAARPPTIEYVVEFFDSTAVYPTPGPNAGLRSFGPGGKLGELWDARNLGWSAYDRIPGKAFFTQSQRSAVLPMLLPLVTHIRVWRLTPTLTTLVYEGLLVDYDATGDDVVFSAFDYLSLLSISRSGYRTPYPNFALGTQVARTEFALGRYALSSPFGFVGVGTFEDPLGSDGSTVIRTNAQFGLMDQMRLQVMYDLSEIGRANTANHVTFGITRTGVVSVLSDPAGSPLSGSPAFNFFKNKGSDIDLGLVLNGNVSEYRHLPNWTKYRNDLATLGTTVGGGLTEVVVKNDTAAADRGRWQDVVTVKTLLGIVGAATNVDQQRAAAERMLQTAMTLEPTLELRMIRGGIDFFEGWDLCDKPLVEIGNGIDTIATRWRIVGARATFDESGEAPSLIVSPVAVPGAGPGPGLGR